MIPKSGRRFSEKIMRKQNARAENQYNRDEQGFSPFD